MSSFDTTATKLPTVRARGRWKRRWENCKIQRDPGHLQWENVFWKKEGDFWERKLPSPKDESPKQLSIQSDQSYNNFHTSHGKGNQHCMYKFMHTYHNNNKKDGMNLRGSRWDRAWVGGEGTWKELGEEQKGRKWCNYILISRKEDIKWRGTGKRRWIIEKLSGYDQNISDTNF